MFYFKTENIISLVTRCSNTTHIKKMQCKREHKIFTFYFTLLLDVITLIFILNVTIYSVCAYVHLSMCTLNIYVIINDIINDCLHYLQWYFSFLIWFYFANPSWALLPLVIQSEFTWLWLINNSIRVVVL